MAAGTMVQLAASVGDVDTSDNLTCTNAFGKAVILNGSNLKVFDPSNSKITTADIGSHPPDHLTKLTGGTSGAIMYVDYITALSSAATIYGHKGGDTTNTFASGETVTGTDDDGNSISFVLNSNEVAPADVPGGHWYDFTVYGQDSSYGVLPSKAYIGALYLGRLYITGNPDDPFAWYASRQRNIFDWVYDGEDVASAVRGGDTDTGDLQDIPRAMVPYGNSYLLFGCASSMYVMINDPRQGGTLRKVSKDVGMFGARSYCYDEHGNLYFFGTGGIYRMSPDTFQIEHMTEYILPKLLADEAVDPSTHRISMVYDLDRHGMMIAITKLSDSTNSCYWFEKRAGAFFPETYPNVCSPYSMLYYKSATTGHKGVVMGCGDGYPRTLKDDQKDDDIGATTQAIDSYVFLGPFQMGEKLGDEGVFTSLHGILAGGASGGSESDSSNVTWDYYVGDSPEKVMENAAAGTSAATGTLRGPGYVKGKRSLKRVRGKYGAIRLRNNTASQTWGFEEIEVLIEPMGRL